MIQEIKSTGGVITTKDWVVDDMGISRRSFFADMWRIVTDNDMPIDGFRSSEKWSAIAYKYNADADVFEFAAIIPGCQVLGFVATDERPWSTDVGNLSYQKRI